MSTAYFLVQCPFGAVIVDLNPEHTIIGQVAHQLLHLLCTHSICPIKLEHRASVLQLECNGRN